MDRWLLVVTCPKTGTEIETGFAVSQETFNTLNLVNIPVKCSACRGRHFWSGVDARLVEAASEQEPRIA